MSNDAQVTELIREAAKLRYSRRQLLKRASALGLSATAVNLALTATSTTATSKRSRAFSVPAKLQGNEPVELRWAAQKHPALDLAFERLQVWAEQTGKARIIQAPISYEVFVEKLSAELLLDNPSVDITWHNDDWGTLWGQYLEPLDALESVVREKADANLYDPYWIWDGKLTGLPWVQTLQTFFIRTDLIAPEEVIEWTWSDMVERLGRLQQDGKVKWGFVGGMNYPHTYFTWLWSIWANNTDIYLPAYERNNDILSENGWKSGLREENWVEVANFWWDNIFTHKLSPPGMPGYSRTDADAIFMAGNAAMINNDTTLYGEYTDPEKSKVADRVGFAGFPMGPSADKRIGHQASWGFAIPKNVDAERKEVAKEALEWLFTDEESQRLIWTETGGLPTNRDVVQELQGSDELFAEVTNVTIDAPRLVLPSYYFAQWPQAHSTLSDGLNGLVTGDREDIPSKLQELAQVLEEIPE